MVPTHHLSAGQCGLSSLTLRSLSLSDILLGVRSRGRGGDARHPSTFRLVCASASVPGRLQPPHSEGLPYKAAI